mgnify:CR=1 FL=1
MEKSPFALTGFSNQQAQLLKAEVERYMSKWHSVGVLRLILDLWKLPNTHNLIEGYLRRLAKRHRVKVNKVFPYAMKEFERFLRSLGYEVVNGVVNRKG